MAPAGVSAAGQVPAWGRAPALGCPGVTRSSGGSEWFWPFEPPTRLWMPQFSEGSPGFSARPGCDSGSPRPGWEQACDEQAGASAGHPAGPFSQSSPCAGPEAFPPFWNLLSGFSPGETLHLSLQPPASVSPCSGGWHLSTSVGGGRPEMRPTPTSTRHEESCQLDPGSSLAWACRILWLEGNLWTERPKAPLPDG